MIIDLHNDLLTAKHRDKWNDELCSYKAADAKTALAVWTTELRPTAEDMARFAEFGSIQSPGIAIEDLGSVVTDDFDTLFKLCSPIYASLTWNSDNRLAGGCGCEKPVTKLGLSVIESMAKYGVALDLSHLSDTAFFDALDKCRGKVLVTHTASRRLSDHPRCITDDMAKKCAERGGIIGVAAVPNFLDSSLIYGENTDRKKYALHIAHFASVVGCDCVAIGTDFNGCEYYPRGMESYADFSALAEDMRGLGFSGAETDKIFYGNAERFFGLAKENL